MKKFTTLAILTAMLLSLFACGGENVNDPEITSGGESTTPGVPDKAYTRETTPAHCLSSTSAARRSVSPIAATRRQSSSKPRARTPETSSPTRFTAVTSRSRKD